MAVISDTTDRMEDALARAAGGDSAAFAELVHEHQAMIFSLAWHFLRDHALAEELGQEVFLHLHRNMAAIQSPEHLLFWLRKVTCHRAIDQSRRRRFWPRWGLEQIPEPPVRPVASDPLLDRMLKRLVASLPEKQRMIVILRFQEDLRPSEIAELLDIPVGTVKSQLQRSLEVLRRKLGSLEGSRQHEAS